LTELHLNLQPPYPFKTTLSEKCQEEMLTSFHNEKEPQTMQLTSGEIYFIGERDHLTGVTSPYFKIGIVRADDARDTMTRLKEHQTGNPRPLFIHTVIPCDLVERVETLMHGLQARYRLGGSEWFEFDEFVLEETIRTTKSYAEQTSPAAKIFQAVEELKTERATDVVLPATDELKELHLNLLVAEATVKKFDEVKGEISKAMREAIERGEPVGGAARIAKTSNKEAFDTEAFKVAYPEMYEKYLKTTVTEGRRWSLSRAGVRDEIARRLADKIDPVIAEINVAIAAAQAGDIPKSQLNDQVLVINEGRATAAWEAELYLAELKVAVGTNAGIEGLCKWGMTSTPKTTFQATKFMEENFDLYKQFLVLRQVGGAMLLNPGQNAAEEPDS